MADWTEPFIASYRFMRVDHSTMMETEEIGNLEQSGSISRNADTSLKESGKLTAHGAFDIGSDYLRVYIDAEGMYTGWRESVALGTFIASISSRSVDGPYSTSSVKLTGLLKVAEDDDFDAPVTVGAGTNVVGYVRSIFEDVGLSVEADASDYALSASWTFGAETDEDNKLSAANELLDIAGFQSARTNEYGTVLLRRYVQPSDKAAAHSFVEGVNARFLSQMTDELDTSEVKNVMKVIYSNSEATVVGVAEDDDPNSKWSTVTLGRRVVGRERYDDVVEQDVADAKAEELLRNSQSVIHRVKMRHVLVPGLTFGDVVGTNFPTGGVSGDFQVRTQDIELGAGCMVDAEIKRSER